MVRMLCPFFYIVISIDMSHRRSFSWLIIEIPEALDLMLEGTSKAATGAGHISI
jgi:hypothetical protein